MDFVQTTLDGESVKIINITGSERNTSIAYIDSLGNLKVKVKPVSWEDFGQNKSLSTGAEQEISVDDGIVQSSGLLTLNGVDRSFNNLRIGLMRAKIGGGNLKIAVVGDSTLTGMGARLGGTEVSGCRVRSIGNHMSRLAENYFGLPGNVDSIWGFGAISQGSDYTTFNAYDPRCVLSGSVGFDNIGGTLGYGPFKLTAVGQSFKFTPKNPFTHTKIYSVNNQGTFGSARLLIDNVETGGVIYSSGGNGLLITQTTTSGSSITVSALENKTFDLIGIETWNANVPGISILEMGWSGAFMANMASSAQPYNHARALASVSADIIILKCTTNDCTVPTPVSAFKNSLQSFILSQSSKTDIYFADLFPSFYQNDKPTLLDQYKNAAKELGVAILDLRDMYGKTSGEAISTGLAIGNVHSGEIAYATIAQMYLERLKPWI